jgi:hypothetical protein
MTAWTTHCKNYAAQNGCSYKEAMSRARPSDTPTSGGSVKTAVRKTKNTAKRVLGAVGPIVSLVDPEIGAAMAVSKKALGGSFRTQGGSFKTHGGNIHCPHCGSQSSAISKNHSSVMGPMHPSFTPIKPPSHHNRIQGIY